MILGLPIQGSMASYLVAPGAGKAILTNGMHSVMSMTEQRD